MRYTRKRILFSILVFVIIAALIAGASRLGIGTTYSGIRIGYIEHGGWRSWSASYTLLDGSMRHALHPENPPETLHIGVATEEGSISVEITDAGGNVVFYEENIGTATFDVEVPGKVTVCVVGDRHKGSFSIGV